MKLGFRSAAQSDIARIFDYLDGQSPQARHDLETGLRPTLERLLGFPSQGKRRPAPALEG